MFQLFVWFWWLWLFVSGTCLASFLSVVVDRTLVEKDWTKGRSRCDHCSSLIAWYDNIPLLSFLLLRGRCRNCSQPIDSSLFLRELVLGFSFPLISFALFGLSLPSTPLAWLQLGLWLLILIVTWLIFWFDLKALIIPNSLVVGLLALSLVKLVLNLFSTRFSWLLLAQDVLPALLLVLFFGGLWVITHQKGFGMGDVKLALPLGLLAGFPEIIIMVFSAFIIGAIWGIILLITGQKKFGQVLPFGPFLLIGFWISLIWGDLLWQAYWQLLI